MDKLFWNGRYAENATVYGTAPSPFFKQFIDKHKPGSILLPADGEGRNGVYAAQKGWQVDAFDISDVAQSKALAFAENKRVKVNYWLQEIENYTATKKYDAIALVYVHLQPALRRSFHKQVQASLEPGGFLVFEAFAREQLHLDSGGPKDINMLYDAPTVCSDFTMLHVLNCGQKEIVLDEGPFHIGKAAVLQMVGQRL